MRDVTLNQREQARLPVLNGVMEYQMPRDQAAELLGISELELRRVRLRALSRRTAGTRRAPGSWRHSQTGSSPRWRVAVRLGQEHLDAGISARLVLVAGPLPPFPGQPVQIDQPGAVGRSYGNEPPGNEPPGPPQRGPRGPPWEKRVSELPSPVHRSGMPQPAQPGWACGRAGRNSSVSHWRRAPLPSAMAILRMGGICGPGVPFGPKHTGIEQPAEQARSIRPAAKRVKAVRLRDERDATGRIKSREVVRAELAERQAAVDTELGEPLQQIRNLGNRRVSRPAPGFTRTGPAGTSVVARATTAAHSGQAAMMLAKRSRALFPASPRSRGLPRRNVRNVRRLNCSPAIDPLQRFHPAWPLISTLASGAVA